MIQKKFFGQFLMFGEHKILDKSILIPIVITMIIRESKIRNAIRKTNGRFFSVRFIKANGESRKMVARLGVKRYLKGGESTTAHKDNLITVFDVQKREYRNINLTTVYEMNGKTI